MTVVHIPATLRGFSEGRDRVQVTGGTLRQVFESLEAECPGIRSQLLDEDGIRPGLAVFVDDILTVSGLVQAVPDSSTVHILPALGGGALRAG